jgi:hypothetical protein
VKSVKDLFIAASKIDSSLLSWFFDNI